MIVRKISKNCKILAKDILLMRGYELSDGDVVLLRLEWDGDSYPGCFFQLLPRNEYLRRPISLLGSGDGCIELAIRVNGSGTRDIVSRNVGDFVECFGPLGRGFEVVSGSRFLVVGGGIGVAPLHPLVRALREVNPSAEIDFVMGFKDALYLTDGATHIAAEDLELAASAGAAGYDAAALLGDGALCEKASRRRGEAVPEFSQGMVTPVAERLLSENKYDEVYACGPEVMLNVLGKLFLERGYDAQLLTEAHFACGVGACLGCTREARRAEKYVRVCADGPMFRASEVLLGDDALFADSGQNGGCRCGGHDAKHGGEHGGECEGARGISGSGKSDGVYGAGGDCTYAAGAADGVLAVNLGRLKLKSLLTMASGTFGFGREYNEFFDIGILGAVSVKGLTLAPKDGNPGRRVVEVFGGMINSVGLQNPGAEYFLAHETQLLREKNVAIIANINGESAEDLKALAAVVDPYVDAVELNISCPNVAAGGMSFGTDPRATKAVVSTVRSVVKKPLIVKLTPNVTDITEIARICEAEGAEILSLINTVTGLAVDYRTGKKPLNRGFGGMSGAAVKPIALRNVSAVAACVSIPIIGMGGISSARDVVEFLKVGASAVAIGTAIFRDPLLPVKIDSDLRKILKEKGVENIAELA